ncbi:MAG TPA: preprotein translocase subunit SecE [Candidatus Eisenbacteria bacterium]|jgi:preprotein translocase subunit SecE|nr:preprotein translocase subunit SecE [Candidatus Eisenbacteria bacterium]
MAISLSSNKFVTYVKESKDELRKVAWPSRKVVIRDTVIVVCVSVSMAIFFGVVDYGLSTGLEKLLTLQ